MDKEKWEKLTWHSFTWGVLIYVGIFYLLYMASNIINLKYIYPINIFVTVYSIIKISYAIYVRKYSGKFIPKTYKLIMIYFTFTVLTAVLDYNYVNKNLIFLLMILTIALSNLIYYLKNKHYFFENTSSNIGIVSIEKKPTVVVDYAKKRNINDNQNINNKQH